MRLVVVALTLAALGCADSGPLERGGAVRRGEQLFQRGLTANQFTCATCHRATAEPADERLLPGADLGGVTERPTYWGGAEIDLLRALGYCQTYFMRVEKPLAASDPEAADLYAFLESLPGSPDAVPFTVVRAVENLPLGHPIRGVETYARACAGCHGALVTGVGKLARTIPALPGDFSHEHGVLDPLAQRLVVVEKVRHGGFLGYGGEMPPFSLEALPDSALAEILSALGLSAGAEEP